MTTLTAAELKEGKVYSFRRYELFYLIKKKPKGNNVFLFVCLHSDGIQTGIVLGDVCGYKELGE